MTRAALGLLLLLVVVFMAWRSRQIALPLFAALLALTVASSSGVAAAVNDGLDGLRAGFNAVAAALF